MMQSGPGRFKGKTSSDRDGIKNPFVNINN